MLHDGSESLGSCFSNGSDDDVRVVVPEAIESEEGEEGLSEEEEGVGRELSVQRGWITDWKSEGSQDENER